LTAAVAVVAVAVVVLLLLLLLLRLAVEAEARARVGVELARDVGEDLLADDLAVLDALGLGGLCCCVGGKMGRRRGWG
jgi:hypothetical protein